MNKSTWLNKLAKEYKKKICYTAEEFLEELSKSKKGDVILFDEVRTMKKRGDTNGENIHKSEE